MGAARIDTAFITNRRSRDRAPRPTHVFDGEPGDGYYPYCRSCLTLEAQHPKAAPVSAPEVGVPTPVVPSPGRVLVPS